ncbi:gp24 [Streptococcus pneumoniae]|nr:gp24 [Streptococcus pneumoniae]
MMEELKQKVNAVYNWTVEDGKPKPPKQDLTTSSERPGGLFLGNGRRWYDVYGSDGMHLR